MDKELNEHLSLTSANSINVARFLPQAFYYFYAYAQLKRAGKADNAVICVPSGNFGNITAGLFGKKMGLPVKRFIAANNRNIYSINTCKQVNIIPAHPLQPLPTLWTWVIRATLPVCLTCMAVLMLTFPLRFRELHIPRADSRNCERNLEGTSLPARSSWSLRLSRFARRTETRRNGSLP